MPEKMTTDRSGYRPARGRFIFPSGSCRPRGEREQRVQQRRDLPERRAGQGGRIEDARDPSHEVAEQVAGTTLGVDADVDLVRALSDAEQVQVDRPEIVGNDLARLRKI